MDLLRRTSATFRVEVAEIVLFSGDQPLRTALARRGTETRMEPLDPELAEALLEVVGDSQAAVLLERQHVTGLLARVMDRREVRQALIAPVPGRRA